MDEWLSHQIISLPFLLPDQRVAFPPKMIDNCKRRVDLDYTEPSSPDNKIPVNSSRLTNITTIIIQDLALTFGTLSTI